MHSIFLTGNVGLDPIVKTFDNGGKVANFSVADTVRGYKTKDGKEIPDHTEWFRCVVRQPGLCGVVEQYIKKGSKVGIVGKLKTREYDDKGEKKSVTELIVESMELLTPRENTGTQSQSLQATNQPAAEDKSDLPF